MLGLAKKLRQAGVLGLNERNADYISRLNPRRFYPRVDDKVLTKKLALDAGMAVPELYGVIRNQGEVRSFADIVAERDSFVVKPAQGSGGDGILVVTGRSQRRRDSFRLASGLLITADQIEHHLSNIVSGQYSLSGNPDNALIEYCVKFDPVFADVSYQGRTGYSGYRISRLPGNGDGALADTGIRRQSQSPPGRGRRWCGYESGYDADGGSRYRRR